MYVGAESAPKILGRRGASRLPAAAARRVAAQSCQLCSVCSPFCCAAPRRTYNVYKTLWLFCMCFLKVLLTLILFSQGSCSNVNSCQSAAMDLRHIICFSAFTCILFFSKLGKLGKLGELGKLGKPGTPGTPSKPGKPGKQIQL